MATTNFEKQRSVSVAQNGVDQLVLEELAAKLQGELQFDGASRTLYATDASEYREIPLAVAFPESDADLRELVRFAGAHGVGLIPRAAGTSLAGQVVGSGIVVDIGRHRNRILGVDATRRRVRVQPGVVRNELNLFLKEHDLFFAPETSTANRAMIGGMVGNNSCGANSIVYGTTREHLISARGFLSDGSEVEFRALTPEEFLAKCEGPDTLETRIYQCVRTLLENPDNRGRIKAGFPKPGVTRRNTGYALDRLMDCAVFDPESEKPFNLCNLLAGSEGTLFFATEFELNCEPLPPPGALMCAHFETLADSLKATVIVMRHHPFGCELIDRHILECTKENLEHAKNRFFVEGDPAAVLVIDIRHSDRVRIEKAMREIEAELRTEGLGYAFPVLWGEDVDRVWELRRAGQGLMNNVKGDAKPREVVEDTAVAVEDLPDYIAEFDALLQEKYGVQSVYYAHAGAGELHTRPLFDLKTTEGLKKFRGIATDVAALVKKYQGSLSGEHGDGRLRGEFIPFMVGPECYEMMRRIKQVFDPNGIFNPAKIIDTPPMDTSLRHTPGHSDPDHATNFHFDADGGILRAAERCTGVGECRKSHLMGGTMCPSYMATREEKDTTRARANALREALAHPRGSENPWTSEMVSSVMDLCLSCKGCKSECPANVDIARLKAEWQQQYYDAMGVPLRSRLIAGFTGAMRMASLAPWAWNLLFGTPFIRRALNRAVGFHPDRTIPLLPKTTLAKWHQTRNQKSAIENRKSKIENRNSRVYLFCDEFTNYNDTDIGIKTIELLERLGYEVVIPKHVESGRAHFSKGLVRDARRLAIRNVELLADIITPETPLIGIEPSAILSFRDEYPDLVPEPLRGQARKLAGNTLLVDEFFGREIDAGRITSDSFRPSKRTIKLHGHCHQKALSSLTPTVKMLELPPGHEVRLIPSGCCGMAGSFGYEAEHHALSQQIGELVLFPAVRAADPDTLIAAPGTSCRHQIKDATQRKALHPVEILHEALA